MDCAGLMHVVTGVEVMVKPDAAMYPAASLRKQNSQERGWK